jgi:hypothetical protein
MPIARIAPHAEPCDLIVVLARSSHGEVSLGG